MKEMECRCVGIEWYIVDGGLCLWICDVKTEEQEKTRDMGQQSNIKSVTDTVHSPLLTYASMISLLTLCPPFVILL